MTQGIFPVSTSDEWVLISSVTPSVASTVSFTSIAGYKKLLLSARNPGFSLAPAITLTLNSDTGTNYIYKEQTFTASTGAAGAFIYGAAGSVTNMALGTHSSGNFVTHLLINDANTNGIKSITGFMLGGAGANLIYQTEAAYFGSASISTVTLTTVTGTFTASGTVALYGVKV